MYVEANKKVADTWLSRNRLQLPLGVKYGYNITISQPHSKVNPRIEKFSLKEPVEQVGNLVAVHNLDEAKLKGNFELGGLPVPSIAITKAEMGHSGYGDISLVFGSDTINPVKYCEAKPFRAVGFDEARYAIVPDECSDDVKQKLSGCGISVIEYETGNETDRRDKLNSLNDVKFSVEEDFATQIDEVLNDTFDNDNHVYVGKTPNEIVKILGIPNLPLLMTSNHVYSAVVSKNRRLTLTGIIEKLTITILARNCSFRFPKV